MKSDVEKENRKIMETAVLGFVLERTAKRMKQYFQHKLQGANTGITVDQWVIIQALHQQNGQSQLELATATFKDAPTVTRIIDLLAKKELVERTPNPSDRRKFKITLTNKGQNKFDEVWPLVEEGRKEAWGNLAPDQFEQLMENLNIIFENIKE